METSHFLYFFFGGENHTFFFGRSCPSSLLSGAAHSECGVSTPLGEEGFSRTPPWPLGLQLQHALAAGGLACALATY